MFASLASHFHVGGVLGERYRDEIHAERHRRANVFHVFRGQRRRRQAAALAVDALVVRQLAADLHRCVDLAADHADDVQHDQAVVEQQHVARFQVARQVLVVETGALLVAEFAFGVEDERLAGDEHDLAVFKLADPDLRALQVGHDGDFTAGLAGRFAHEFGALAVVVGSAVREIEPHHVQPCPNHLQQDFRRAGSRSDGSDNLGSAMHESPRLDGIAGMSAASRMRRLRTEGCYGGLRAG